jgi:subtilase family serine protease
LTKTISIKFRVTNSGNVAAGPFKVTFHLSNNGSTPLAAFKEVQVDGLAVKKNTLLTVDHTFEGSIYGKYILIFIDPDKELPEINETNNGTRIVVQSVATK